MPDTEDVLYNLLSQVPETNYFLIDNKEKLHALARPMEVLTLSGTVDTKIFDNTVESGHEDDALRAVFALLFWRYHLVDQITLRTCVILKRVSSKSPLYENIRQRCLRWNSSFKSKVLEFYHNGVTKTMDAMDDKAAMTMANKPQRRAFWAAIYNKDPALMAKASCVGMNGSVPIEEIFSYGSPTHVKWQRFLKTVFVSSADDAFLYRYMATDDNAGKKKCGDRWNAMPLNPKLKNVLQLGDIDDIPVKASGIHDQGKSSLARMSEIDLEDEIEVRQFFSSSS